MEKIKWYANIFNAKNDNMVDYVEYKSLKDTLLYHADDEQAKIFGINENEEVIDIKNTGEVLTNEQEKELLKKFGELNGNE